jgi:zinc transport system ATP-binding protein
MTPLVTLRNLSVSLGGHAILRGVNADIDRGRITCVVGLNGSGKTTLLRALLHEVPYRGTVRFHCGHDHTKPTPEHIGYVPQRLRLEANLPITVRDLFGMALQTSPIFLGVPKPLVQRIQELLKIVGAREDLLDKPLDKISGGEQQRVLLALAMHPEPELLLLDEPAAGIDFQDEERFYELIAQLNRDRGVTVLMVSHDLAVVGRHAHHLLCLKHGRVEFQGTPTEVLAPEMLDKIFARGPAGK